MQISSNKSTKYRKTAEQKSFEIYGALRLKTNISKKIGTKPTAEHYLSQNARKLLAKKYLQCQE